LDFDHGAGHDKITDTKVEAEPCAILMSNLLQTIPVPIFQSFFRTSGEGRDCVCLVERYQLLPWAGSLALL
jgi:hypothetical protein